MLDFLASSSVLQVGVQGCVEHVPLPLRLVHPGSRLPC